VLCANKKAGAWPASVAQVPAAYSCSLICDCR
jgi:hypothetical protein